MAIFPNVVGAEWRGAVTIPNNAGTGSRLLDLMRAAGYDGPDACAVKVLARVPDGTDRSAFVIASRRPNAAAISSTDFTTHGQHVAAGTEYAEPVDRDASESYVRSTGASTVSAIVLAAW